MSYATTTEITDEFKKLEIDAVDSIVDAAKVTRFINEASAEIDTYIANKYLLPITGSSALLFLKKICIDLVSFRIVKIISIKKAVPASKNAYQEILEGKFYDEAMEKLKMLAKGHITLVDAETQGKSSIRSYTKENNVTPVFKKDERQW